MSCSRNGRISHIIRNDAIDHKTVSYIGPEAGSNQGDSVQFAVRFDDDLAEPFAIL